MVEGIYATAADMMAKIAQQDLAANNLANINTTGYKKDRLFFQDLISAQDYPTAAEGSNPPAVESVTLFEQGALTATGNPLDVAIVGDAFFAVETSEGTAYSRNGSFSLDELGYLVTSAGHRVLGDSGPMILTDSNDVKIKANGEVWQGGQLAGRLLLVRFPDPQSLQKLGDSLFVAAAEGEAVADDAEIVRQGYLESSNVNPIEEMVEMIALFREYEADQRAIQYQDETLRRAINDVGQVS